MNNDMVLISLQEIERLGTTQADFAKLEILIADSSLNIQDQQDVTGLHKKLHDLGVSEDLRGSDGPCGLNATFYQLLSIHFVLNNAPRLKISVSFKEVLDAVTKNVFFQDNHLEPHHILIYQEHFCNVTWHNYLKTAPLKTWPEIEAFRKSIPYCKVIMSDAIDILERFAINFPNDGAVHSMAYKLSEKVKTDIELRQETAISTSAFIANEHVRKFTPRFLLAIVDGDEQKYLQKLEELSGLITKENSVDILSALDLAAPNEALYKDNYIPLLNKYLAAKIISRADYLNLSSKKQVSIEARHDFALDVAQTLADAQEGHAVINYLDNFIEHSQSLWFEKVAKCVLTYSNDEPIHHLNNFLHELAERNMPLIGRLLTARFEALGGKYFLTSPVTRLSEDGAQFSRNLTEWFLSENQNAHSAMRQMCSVHHSISDKRFVLSMEALSALSSSEKLFIAVKIAGYVYSKEPLQNLMISLTNSCNSSETTLLENLYRIFEQYVVYNYRGTLKTLKDLVQKEDLPKHLHDFYSALINSYERYFNQLSNIPDLMELKADYTISRYRNFYEQAMWQDIHAKTKEPDFLSMMKSVSVKSPNWAIRRPGQNAHEVRPLGHFQTSAEFPMGERLNPVFQEKTRRHYQQMKKHEIDIDRVH